MSQRRANLKGATALLVDSDHYTRGVIAQMLRGFGLEAPVLLGSGKEAQDYLQHNYVDICIVEATLPDMLGTELVRWIRKCDSGQVRFMPIIMLTGYTQFHMVMDARDAGASIVVKKPVSAQVLWNHIAWVGRANRAFIETSDYVGPDRRFRSLAPPKGKGRRESDKAAEKTEAEDEKTKAAS